MAYGQGEYGQRDYGGSSFEAGGPQLVSSDPLNGADDVASNATVTFVIGSEAGLDLNTLTLAVDGVQAIVGGVFLTGYAGSISFLDDETQVEVVLSTHPAFDFTEISFDIGITDLAGEAAALNFSFEVPFIISESVTITESLEVTLEGVLEESVTITESLAVTTNVLLPLSEQLSVTEQLSTGLFQVENVGGFQFLVTFDQEMHFDTITDLRHYRIDPNALNPGVPMVLLGAVPQYTTYQTGSTGRFIPEPEGATYNLNGESYTFEFEGSITDPNNLGDFIQVTSGPNSGLYQIMSILDTDVGGGFARVSLDRKATVDATNGSIHLAGALEDVPRIDLVSIRNEGGDPAVGDVPDYVYTFQVVDPRVTVGTPILSIYRVERLARSRVDGLDADDDAINPPPKDTPTFSEVLDPEAATVPGHVFDVTTDVTILDYQTFEVRDASLVTEGIVLRATSGRPPIGGVPTAVTGSYEGFAAVVQLEGTLEWEHCSGVTSVLLNTTKMTGLATYDAQVIETFLKRPKNRYTSPVLDILAQNVPKPKLEDTTVEDDIVQVYFDEDMLPDDGNLNNPEDYEITGPSAVFVRRVFGQGPRQVSLFTQGLSDGDYTLTVSSSTPKDIAGNPVDPVFNTAIFTASTPTNKRSIFTDKGPIMRPPLTLQSGTTSTLQTPNEITLTGAALTLTDIGKRLYLTNSEKNDGNFRVLAILTSERARVQASFSLPDANNGTIDWQLVDTRYGQIADDPADVTVRVNGTPVTPAAVIGLRGQVVLEDVPDPSDDVDIDYTWSLNPKVEIRRLNSLEFRLNGWNRDYGGPSASHHYRYNNVLVTSSDYDPDDMQALRPSPLLRQLKYRAFERAYTASLNDPTTLVLNTPNHKIAFPPASRPLSEVVSFYEGIVLPEANNPAWTRHGGGTASAAAGVLTVTDNSTGTFPSGEPLFWTQALDLSFEHVFSAAWRFSLDSVTTFEGVWTGICAGYSNENQVFIVGYLYSGGARKIGFLRRGALDRVANLEAWTGALDEDGVPTDTPVNFDWSVLHSYRLFTDQNGTVKLYVDGDVVETLRIDPDEAPFLKELNAPFDEIQGAFFGSLSRPAQSTSSWDFYRYFVQPTNVQQVSPSSFVSYEATTVPELDSAPWTPIGFHGTATIQSSNLLLEATSASDATGAGIVGGDFFGYVKLEPLLSQASQFSVDVEVQLLTYTHGIDPNGLMVAVDDGTRLMQLCFIQDVTLPRLSYGGRSFPEDYTPYVWSVLGSQASEMIGRYLRITDEDTSDGLVYFIEDTAPASSTDRVIGSPNDYFIEIRCRVDSYTADGSGFAGAFAQAFDGVRAVGLYLQDIAGVRSVRLHSDGVPVGGSFAFEWNDGEFHTFRLRKSTTGNLVSLFVDATFLGSVAYSSFATPSPDVIGVLSFGSSTAASAQAESVVTWAYCNAWRVNTDTDPITAPKKYIGLWKGSNTGTLLDYHLPLKASGQAAVVGNTLVDPLADFVAALVAQGDRLVVDVEANQGVYYVSAVVNSTTLALTTAWGVQPSQVDYRIVDETDWSTSNKYRLVKDPNGSLAVFFEADAVPLITAGYNSLELPESSAGIVQTLSNGLAAIAFGSFNPEHLVQSQWDFVRYGITRYSGDHRTVPPHQILNQWNTMESPERLYTVIPHTRTSFKSSSTGTTSQEVTDFLSREDVEAFTQLNEGTPLVPSTQSFELRGPYPSQITLVSLNDPEDVLESPSNGFIINDGALRYTVEIPEDVLYTALRITESSAGETSLIKPFDDDYGPRLGSIQYQKEVCLSYEADALPEDTVSSTSWQLNSDDPDEVLASVLGGILTYGTTGDGTRTVYLNNTPLPDAPSLQTEVNFRLRLASDATGGVGDSQVRFGLSAPGMTIALGFVTTPMGDRYLLVYDLNNGSILGHSTFDYLDGNYHTYRIVRTPGRARVEVYIDP